MLNTSLRLLALDFGQKHFGLATYFEGEDLFPSVLPVLDVRSEAEVLEHILKLLKEHEITLIILGHPIDEEGRSTWITEKVEAFAQKLTSLTPIPLTLVDEYGTSDLARERLNCPSKKKKVRVDSLAAGLLIEKFLREKKTL